MFVGLHNLFIFYFGFCVLFFYGLVHACLLCVSNTDHVICQWLRHCDSRACSSYLSYNPNTPILQWDFTVRHYLRAASIISALLDKSVHPRMIPWLLLLRRTCFVALYQMNSRFVWYCSETYSPSSASPACVGQSRGKPALSASVFF